MPVAIENCGWFDSFQTFVDKAPPVSDAIEKCIPNHLVSVGCHIAEHFVKLLTSSPDLVAIMSALGFTKDSLTRGIALFAMNKFFRGRKGPVIETTPALEDMLVNADIASDLPVSFFAAPYSSVYIHFGKKLKVVPSEPGASPSFIVGAYVTCIEVEAHIGDKGNPMAGEVLDTESAHYLGIKEGDRVKRIEVLTIVQWPEDDGSAECNCLMMEAVVKVDSEEPLIATLRNRMLRREGPPEIANMLEQSIEHISKIFLYLGLSGVRVQHDLSHTDQVAKISELGQKKKGKAERKLQKLYDRIIVGPASSEVQENNLQEHDGYIRPHMRRGHFRSQRHGSGNLLKKVIFVAPVLVRADLINGNAPAPKNYTVS